MFTILILLYRLSSTIIVLVLCEQEAVEVPPQDRWRIPYLSSLLSQRRVAKNLASEETVDHLTQLIDSLVRN